MVGPAGANFHSGPPGPLAAWDNGTPMAERGFVLTPTYRVVAGRPEVHLHAVLESGEPALVVDDRLAPYLFVRAAEADAVRRLRPQAGGPPAAPGPVARGPA